MLLCLVVVEFSMWLWFPVLVNPHVFNASLNYIGIPYHDYVVTSESPFHREFLFHRTTNSMGFVDTEHNITKSAGVYRILIVGDSFMECGSADFSSCYGVVLQKELNDRCHINKTFEVVMMGVGGYSIDNEYQTYELEGKQYNPDMVLIAFFIGNDFQLGLAKKAADGTITYVDTPHPHWYSWIGYWLEHNSHLFTFAMHMFSSFRTTSAKAYDQYLFTKGDDYGQKLGFYEEVYSQFVKDLRVDNRTTVTLVIPTKEEVDTGKYADFIATIGVPPLYPQVRQDIIGFFTNQSDMVIDPLLSMQQYNKNNTFYWNIDGHWNNQGHEFAAGYSVKKICDYLLPQRKSR
jgi:hypothetical protein